jgi:hypothetical protein
MNQLERHYEVTRKDLAKNKALIYGAWISPIVLAVIPALIFFILFLTLGTSRPAAATYFFLSLDFLDRRRKLPG